LRELGFLIIRWAVLAARPEPAQLIEQDQDFIGWQPELMTQAL
jgi:hypothetical protein